MEIYFEVFVLVLLSAHSTAVVKPRSRFEAGLLKLIEKCRDGDVQSLPLEVPPLTSIKIPANRLYFGEYTMFITDTKFKGLENLSVEKLSTYPSGSKMTLEILVPTLGMRADRYHLQSKLIWGFLRLIDDKGIFNSYIHNLKVWVNVEFEAEGNNTVITSLTLNYSAGNVEARLSGSSKAVNEKVRDRIWQMIQDDELKNNFRNSIISAAKTHLQGRTPQDYVGIIAGI